MSGARSARDLDGLIDEITVDAYEDDEQLTGFLVAAEEVIEAPEPASIVGVDVEVIAIDTGPDARTGLLSRCRRGGGVHEVAFADLTFPAASELGLIRDAYRRWQGRKP